MKRAMLDAIMSDAEYMRGIRGYENAMPNLFWAKAHPDTIIPTKREGDVGYDIYARFDEDYIVIKPHETKGIPTDLHCAFSEDYEMTLKERGSTGMKGMGLRAGVIEGNFRGKIFVAITNHNNNTLIIAKDSFIQNQALDVKNINMDFIIEDDNNHFHCPVLVHPYSKAICQATLRVKPKLRSQEITLDELLAIESERGQGMLGDSGK